MDRREQRFKKRTAVTKEQALDFPCANDTAEQNEKSNGITQPSGAAAPRNSDAHERIAVPKALRVLWERPRPRPKSGKVRRSDTRPRRVSEPRKTLRG